MLSRPCGLDGPPSGTKLSFRGSEMRCFSFQSWSLTFEILPEYITACFHDLFFFLRSCSGSDLSPCSLPCIFLTIVHELSWRCSPKCLHPLAKRHWYIIIITIIIIIIYIYKCVYIYNIYNIRMFLVIITFAQATWEGSCFFFQSKSQPIKSE